MAKEKTEQVLKEQRTAAETDKNVSEEKVKNKKEKPPNAPESLKEQLI